MQKRSSDRVSKKSYTLAEFGQTSAIKEAQEMAENALIINPYMPTVELAESLFLALDSDLCGRLAAVLVRRLFSRLVRAGRIKQTRESRQYLIPGFEHLPRKITISSDGKKTSEILEANIRGVREYYRNLMKDYRNRRNNDPKIKEVLVLLELMRKHAAGSERITVRQVLLLEGL